MDTTQAIYGLIGIGLGYLIGSMVEWSLAMKREDALMARLGFLSRERQDAEHVIRGLREIIARESDRA